MTPSPTRLHWHIAWRHLRVGDRPPPWVGTVLFVALYLVLVGAGMALYAAYGLTPGITPDLGDLALPDGILAADILATPTQTYVGVFGGFTLLLGAMLLLGAILSRIFTLLATVITISVMLGCMALVVVLSLMTGLEHDLRDKILGQRAHIRISRVDTRPFSDYDALAREVAALPGVTGASPYLQGEVMVRSGFQRQGGILLGIVPDLHANASNLPDILREGKYDYLSDPSAVPDSALSFEMLPPVRVPEGPDEDGDDDKPDGKPGDLSFGTAGAGKPTLPATLPSVPGLPPSPHFADGDDEGWEDPEQEIPKLRQAGKLPPASKVPAPGLVALPPSAAIPRVPRDPAIMTSDDDEGWEDPEQEIARLRKEGKLPPAVAAPPEATPEPEPESEPESEEDPTDDPVLDGIFIGSEKAKELAAHLGDPVQLITPIGRLTPAGRIPGVMKVKVAGVFDANHYEYDRWLVYSTLPIAQAFLRAGDRVSGIEVKIDDVDQLAERRKDVEAVVAAANRLAKPVEPGPPGEPGQPPARPPVVADGRDDLVVQDWQELNRSLFSAMALEKIAVFIALLCVILVASFGILGSNLMSVLEKAREIAILKTMGCTDNLIQRVFTAEGLCLGVLGGTLGILAGIALCLVLDRYGLPLGGTLQGFEELPVTIDVLEIVLVGLSSLAIVWLSSLYPARIASRMRPVDALRQAER